MILPPIRRFFLQPTIPAAGRKGGCERGCPALRTLGRVSPRHARPCAGHPRLEAMSKIKDVDGRDIGERSDAVLRTAMPGHDDMDGSHVGQKETAGMAGRFP